MRQYVGLIAGWVAVATIAGTALSAPRDLLAPTSTVIPNQNGDGRIEVLAQGDGPVDRTAAVARPRRSGFRRHRGPAGDCRLPGGATAAARHRAKRRAARPASTCTTMRRTWRPSSSRRKKARPSSSVMRSVTASRACSPTDRPELISAVGLVAANIGKAPSTPKVREAIRNSANPALPDAERIKALQFAFFAPGNDPRAWLKGWYPDVLAAERARRRSHVARGGFRRRTGSHSIRAAGARSARPCRGRQGLQGAVRATALPSW